MLYIFKNVDILCSVTVLDKIFMLKKLLVKNYFEDYDLRTAIFTTTLS